ncbi:MAG: (2E,6E)-farnesyl diphosphate synthase [Gammaproteobacteria bacterium]|nr:(2E,6E)-farnesyl diphosphate synthase [Gammaproteobacteria bacterium]MDP2348583.1 (2E,6E)-farnesyl diphosphate synthase [Gammaproteobacteria bacterium]
MNSPAAFDLDAFMEQCQQRIQSVLTTQLDTLPPLAVNLRKAMQYACLQGGKRVRPLLVYAGLQAFGEHQARADVAACAIELMHCYSLVHDDLPAMDDDDLRRGNPTVHIAFNEATAILAGDALQSLAFRLLSDPSTMAVSDTTRLRMINLLASAGGYEGMVAGQSIDFDAVGRTLTLTELETMHRLKTGALISASVRLGAMATERASESQLAALHRYSEYIGLAFQVQDDILDVTSDTATLGKTQGADEALNKPTYVSLLGLEGARTKAAELCNGAVAALDGFDHNAEALRQIAHYIVERRH